MLHSDVETLIIGAGLSGLCCARALQKQGMSTLIVEADDQVGGRVQTDRYEGFLLDRGFQVFLTAYPEAEQVLDYQALDLRSYQPGALVQLRSKRYRFADPWRQPQHLLATATSPVATLADKLRIARFRNRVSRGSLDSLYERPEQTTLDLLRSEGFSETIVERFFRPFLGGILLDQELEGSSRACEFVFRMFSQGAGALPAGGMGEIPKQIASQLDSGSVQLHTTVEQIEPNGTPGYLVHLASGQHLRAQQVVVATEGRTAHRLLAPLDLSKHQLPDPVGRSVWNLYFTIDEPPLREPVLLLNGDGPAAGPINNLAVPSLVSPSYSPDGRALVSIAVLDGATDDLAEYEESLVERTLDQLESWFGHSAQRWRYLRGYRIPYALPSQRPPRLDPVVKAAKLTKGLYACGDHLETASINGAIASGRRAAEAILSDR